jgi:hypothetical protein
MTWLWIFFTAGVPAHWRSAKEILTVLVISTAPLTLGALIRAVTGENEVTTYLGGLADTIKQGELFLYCMSVVASIVWLVHKDWLVDNSETRKAERIPPPKWVFNLFAFGAFALCVLFFSVQEMKVKLNQEILITLSSVLYLIAVLMWHTINVMSEILPPNLEKNLADGTDKMMKDLTELRSGNGA